MVQVSFESCSLLGYNIMSINMSIFFIILDFFYNFRFKKNRKKIGGDFLDVHSAVECAFVAFVYIQSTYLYMCIV